MKIRSFTKEDVPALQAAITADKFHPGEWTVKHFYDDPEDKDALKINKVVTVIEDSKGPITFVRYTQSLRISCVWAEADDNSRNARAIIQGLRKAVDDARVGGFTEIIIETNYPKLADFFTKIIKMTKSGDQYLLYV